MGNTFEELNNTDNSEILPVLFERDVQRIQEIVPDTSRNVTETALSRARNINDAVDSMISDTFTANNFNSNDISNHTNKITGLLSPVDVMIEYRDQKLRVRQTCSLHVNRCNLWREVTGFYKTATGSMEKLTFPLDVTFVGENGIDAGDLKAELFTKIFEQAKQELFEHAEDKPWCLIPKRSGGNLQVFKIFGIIVAHSLLHSGPYFNCLALWVVDILLNEESVSGNIQIDHIPVTSSTGNLRNFIKSLYNCNNEQSIKELFDSADGPAFEQLVSSADWDPNEPITVENKEILINLLLYEETIVRRGKKLEAMREGLKVMGLAPFFCMDATRQLFLGAPVCLKCSNFCKANKLEYK